MEDVLKGKIDPEFYVSYSSGQYYSDRVLLE
jgi:hypothetical protein